MTPPRPIILVVDDDADLLRVAVRVLSVHGYEVLSAEGCAEALEVLEGRAEPIDLLLTDMEMPGMGGDELAMRFEERFPDLRVLFTSGYPAQVMAAAAKGEDARSASARNFIEKPYAMSELARRVREVLDAERPAH